MPLNHERRHQDVPGQRQTRHFELGRRYRTSRVLLGLGSADFCRSSLERILRRQQFYSSFRRCSSRWVSLFSLTSNHVGHKLNEIGLIVLIWTSRVELLLIMPHLLIAFGPTLPVRVKSKFLNQGMTFVKCFFYELPINLDISSRLPLNVHSLTPTSGTLSIKHPSTLSTFNSVCI